MQPALSTPFAQPPIPAWGELSEKPRLGFTSKNPALYLGHNVCNSTAAIGMRAGLALNRVRSRCSAEQYDPDLGLYYLRARYYNPLTGRFLSRDPEDGKAMIPATLHKYLFAGGDPVNAIDPTGKDLVGDVLTRAWSIIQTQVFVRLYCRAVVAVISYWLLPVVKGTHSEIASVLGVAVFAVATGACSYIP
jgi:RHS repeat-associated protein